MMQNVLWWSLILLVPMGCCYMAYLSFTNNIKQKLEKEWQDKHEELTFWEKNLRSRYSQMEEHNKIALASIAQKRNEATVELNKAATVMKLAEQIKADVNLKINSLQKRINQLQSELFKARKRAERLANKLKSTVQIKALD